MIDFIYLHDIFVSSFLTLAIHVCFCNNDSIILTIYIKSQEVTYFPELHDMRYNYMKYTLCFFTPTIIVLTMNIKGLDCMC